MYERNGLPGLPAAYLAPGTSSFTELLQRTAPELMPGGRELAPGVDAGDVAPHGTTIVALRCADGVVMAGDRRSTQGSMIASRDIRKVFPADSYSLVGIAGTAGIGIELVRLYQAELEHFEKLEGSSLSLHGKANKLANMIRGNLGAALQGLVALPLFAGFDLDAVDPTEAGRIFSYDVVGGIYEERDYDSIGSGSIFAKSALKKRFHGGADAETAVRAAIESLYDAADEDSATGGPDLTRNLYPIVMTATAEGSRLIPDERIGQLAREVVEARRENPGG